MIRLVSSLLLVLALSASAMTPAADAARTSTHSGTVVAVDPQGGVMIMEEVGPWRVERGQTVVTRRIVSLTRATIFNSFIRVDVPGRFGRLIEVVLDAEDITPGDFVTREYLHERGRSSPAGDTGRGPVSLDHELTTSATSWWRRGLPERRTSPCVSRTPMPERLGLDSTSSTSRRPTSTG